jgi:TolB-like protein/Flp pilus assembly protein TadD/class 3 adenylate cyclase
MAEEEKTNLRLEIAHVLFMDIVGYSGLLVDEQREALHELNRLVLRTEAVREAETTGSLIRLPTGDGMALVFTSSMEAPVECALEISQALRAQPSLPLRMGIHSGPVQHVNDVNGRENIAGSGINIAQRVMDCGDAGHILVSKRVADDLAGSRRWAPLLHELGEYEVKNGLIVSMVNLYADVIGNPVPPAKFRGAQTNRGKLVPGEVARRTSTGRWLPAAGLLVLVAALALAGWWRVGHERRSLPAGPSPAAARTGLGPAATVAAAPPIVDKSVAVLPFENLSADKDNAFFADGVQDEILTDLAKVADLKVIARASVLQYGADAPRNLREIAAQLGVAHVLTGSVQRAGNQVRVTAQLTDALTETQQWAERYVKPLDDVFAIQSEIAQAIAGQLRARLSPQEKSAIDAPPTTDIPAYDLYLRAQDLFQRHASASQGANKISEGVGLLEQALARDPKFLSACCLLARLHGQLYRNADHTPARLQQMNAAVQAAVRLQPDAGETHLALADYQYQRRDYAQATAELALARRTLPNDPQIYETTGYMLRRQGQWEESTRNLEQALALDPRNFQLLQQISSSYLQMRRYADAERSLQRALAIRPGDPLTRLLLAEVPLDARADIRPYQTTLAALLAENPSLASELDDPGYAACERTPAAAARVLAHLPPEGNVISGLVIPHAFWEGVFAHYAGDTPRARGAFVAARAVIAKTVAAQPDSAAAVSYLGVIDAGLGRKEDAIREGRRACELLPVSKDAILGANMAANLAGIYAWTGEKAAAVEELMAVERVPNHLPYGQLKLDPEFDDLRGDPSFEALVASLAPKP